MKRLLLIPFVALVTLLMCQWLILKMAETVRCDCGEGMYYTPEHIADIASGSGAFLKEAADDLTENPPYGEHK